MRGRSLRSRRPQTRLQARPQTPTRIHTPAPSRPALGPDESAPILAAERAHLLDLFPDGTVEEAYAVDLTAVRNLRPSR
ncbi:hypothetical protein [Streptomyces sp. NPDC051218]|uniref:hypothetical protein n=1 Tax=Streptomyces sp. NPDC051218 TaxID=3365645 RepID=UPI00379FB71A